MPNHGRLPAPWDDLKRDRPRLGQGAIVFAPGAQGLAPDIRDWEAQFLKKADAVLAAERLPPSQPTGVAPQTDRQLPILAGWEPNPNTVAKELVRRMQYLCGAWQLTRKPDYVAAARQELLNFSRFPNWHPEMFLATARAAYGVAIGFDLLHDALDAEARAEIGQALLDKAIQPALDQFAQHPRPFWTHAPHNWTLVCMGGLMVAAMAAAELDPERTRRLFDQCHAGLHEGLRGYALDGAWFEGPGYWSLGTEYFIFLLDAMRFGLTGGMRELDRVAGFATTGQFRRHAGGPSGLQFNYADSEEGQALSWQMGWLARHFGHPVAPDFAPLDQDAPDPLDLMWSTVPVDGLTLPPTSAYFRACEVVTMRGDWTDRATTYLAIKGGRNQPHGHPHFDLGSFVLDTGGQRWAIELGPDNYGIQDYFKPAVRTRLYRTSTIGHNTLVVDGECQPVHGIAQVTHFAQADDATTAVIDLGAAYPDLAGARRGCALIGGRHVLIVDELAPRRPGATVAWQMHTRARASLAGSRAALALDAAAAPGLHARILEPAGALFTLEAATATYQPPPGTPGEDPLDGIAKLVVRLAPAAPLRLAVLLSPDDADAAVVPPRLLRPLATWG